MSTLRNVRRMLVITLFLAAGLLLTAGTGYCKPPFNDVYNQKRIDAYKKMIRYYNPSVNESLAERISKAIIYYAYQNNIEDDRFVAAVITIESMFNPYAISRSGAMGLGQLMPGTASDMSCSNPFSVEENVNGCCKYLKIQLDRFRNYPRQQQYELALAAYNAGPGAVQRWGGIPPYAETRAYVVNVINVWREIAGSKPMTMSQVASLRHSAAESQKRRAQMAKAKPKPKPKKPVKCVITRTYVNTTVEESAVED